MDYTNKKIKFVNSNLQAKIIQRIVVNANNQVYKCSNVNNPNQMYCLKVITANTSNKESLNVINTEIYVLLNLQACPNIVHLIDYFTLENGSITTCFILMEYCQNGTLDSALKKFINDKNSFSEQQIWNIILKISTGLNALHKFKYAHRDITPENVLIDNDDSNFKLCDFGSATNKVYDCISNATRNEIVFDPFKGHSQHSTAPEILDLYSNYPINEKVDVWSLGILLYSLLYDFLPFSNEIKFITGKNLFLTDEMEKAYSPQMIDLLKMMVVHNPKHRSTIQDVINFIQYNISSANPNKIDLKKVSVSLTQKISNMNTKIFKRHSTQFWVLKLISHSFNSFPKFKYLKELVRKAWTKKNKIVKFYQSISNGPIHYFSIPALKAIYVMHHYIFLGPPECLSPQQFNLEEFIDFFRQIWSTRFSNSSYEREDNFNNIYLTKFIISYSEFLKNKIFYHKKYPLIENNYSISSKIIDEIILIDKNFIIDTLSLYSQIYQKFIQIPLIIKQLSLTLDVLSQLFNEELISIFSLIFYVLIAFKKYYANCNDINSINIYDSHFIEITNKSSEYLSKLQKFRDEVKSMKKVIPFNENMNNVNIHIDYITNLNANLKAFRNNFNDFNIKSHFGNKEIAGIKLSKNMGVLIMENALDEFYTTQGALRVAKKSEANIQTNIMPHINKGFDFSEDKFLNSRTDFDFDFGSKSRAKEFKVQNETMMRSNSFCQNINSAQAFSSQTSSNNSNEKEVEININQVLNSILNSSKTQNDTSINSSSISNVNNKGKNAFKINKDIVLFENSNNKKHNLIRKGTFNNSLPLNGIKPLGVNKSYSKPFESNQDPSLISSLEGVKIKPVQRIQNTAPNELFETPKGDRSNISIVNIVKNYNNYNYVKEGDQKKQAAVAIEKIANDFLKDEFTKPHYQWLINSKNITLGREIGLGASSEVYLGDYRGTQVAVKKIRIHDYKEENLKEFKREVSSLIMLQHPNLVLFMGAIAEPNNISIVTEYCPGGTLFDILYKKKDLIITWELRLKILLEIAIGMNFLHTNQPPIIHRDLKSLNILLTEKVDKPTDCTKIKISDFGLSKIIKQIDGSKAQMTGQLGTCHWMAPEVIENTNYTIKADVYSYSIIIWEICARKTPYGDMSQQQIGYYVAVKKGRPDKALIPPHTPQALVKLMEQCWDSEPNNRPSFDLIIDYLKKIMY